MRWWLIDNFSVWLLLIAQTLYQQLNLALQLADLLILPCDHIAQTVHSVILKCQSCFQLVYSGAQVIHR